MAIEEVIKIPYDLVVAAYRAILNREPESEGIVRVQAEKHTSAEALLVDFLNSEEFRAKASMRYGDHMARVASGYRQQMNPIDVTGKCACDVKRGRDTVRRSASAIRSIALYGSAISNSSLRPTPAENEAAHFHRRWSSRECLLSRNEG